MSTQNKHLQAFPPKIPSPASLASSNLGMPVKRVTRLVLASQQTTVNQRPTTNVDDFRRHLELLSQVNFGLGHGCHQNEIHHPTSGNLEIQNAPTNQMFTAKTSTLQLFKGFDYQKSCQGFKLETSGR